MLNSPKNKVLLVYSFIGIVTTATAALLFMLINRHSVNVIFWDQWDFNIALFGKPTAWEMFTYQHGPHRQGIGLFVSQIIGSLTNWNMRAEAFFIGFVLLLTALSALYLKHRLFGKITAWDALISVICLSFTQCEIAFPNTNPAYTALPLLLVILSGIIITLKNPAVRYSLLVIINFFTVFTGFGIFLGFIVPIILIFALIIHYLEKQRREMLFAAAALLVSILSLALFFTDYKFMPAVDCFQFPHPQPLEYGVFISNMMTMCVGFIAGYKSAFAKPFGLFLFAAWLITFFYQLWIIIKTRKFSPVQIVIFLFLSFSIIYALNTAVGRVCLGTITAQSPRYMTLLIPGWLALYFFVLLWKSDIIRRFVLAVFVILFVILPLRRYNDINNIFAPMTASRQKWVNCYQEQENIEECNKIAGTPVYPNAEATHLQEKLNLLKQNHYNLFSKP